jgi:hypothetical protein
VRKILEQVTVSGDQLVFPDGQRAAPGRDYDLLVSNGENEGTIYKTDSGFYGDFRNFDQTFVHLIDLARYLSTNNFRFIGIDRP